MKCKTISLPINHCSNSMYKQWKLWEPYKKQDALGTKKKPSKQRFKVSSFCCWAKLYLHIKISKKNRRIHITTLSQYQYPYINHQSSEKQKLSWHITTTKRCSTATWKWICRCPLGSINDLLLVKAFCACLDSVWIGSAVTAPCLFNFPRSQQSNSLLLLYFQLFTMVFGIKIDFSWYSNVHLKFNYYPFNLNLLEYLFSF